jgi:hypothetical protein
LVEDESFFEKPAQVGGEAGGRSTVDAAVVD